jgi:hypothetical protein
MVIMSNRDRRRRWLWSETVRQNSDPDADSLVVVCLFSLIGQTLCLLAVKPVLIEAIARSHAIVIVASGIIAAAICAVLVTAGRSDA